MVGLVAAYKKTTDETAGFWRDTGFVRLQQRAGTEHHEQQADQPADNLAGSLPFSDPCSISIERFVFAMCILRFVFGSTSIAARFYWWEKHMFLMFCIAILHILFCPKIKKKCRKLAFSALWKHKYWLALGELRCATCSLEAVLTWPWSEKSSIHVVFRTFPSQ